MPGPWELSVQISAQGSEQAGPQCLQGLRTQVLLIH